ncbi:hypothetical protein CBR_g12256 [Chara braunii]|uniref:Nudix hydrolase domain-containing protein n=1 Tax=Chara braunii TaxID=69332 RepID=A0A388KRR3_CHABU|nr:hypothetical protein CBR_g12256 [Chara braunii]|eukprot:GBG72688.1 hypothetical protein CBR_g12256 [Chara braunii]
MADAGASSGSGHGDAMMVLPPRCPHFVTGNYVQRNVFLGDKEYGMALDCLVKACTDVLLIDEDSDRARILLAKRIVEPQPDWWTSPNMLLTAPFKNYSSEGSTARRARVGGRMRPGETPEESLARLISRELGLEIESRRPRLLGVHSLAWEKRAQAPAENGTCDLSLVYTLVLQEDECSKICLDQKEYSDSRWFRLEEISEGEFHPALQLMVSSSGVPDGVSQWGKIEDKSVSHRNAKGDDECAVDARRRPSAAEERPKRERACPQQSPQPEEEEEGQSAE